jgi:hypothetical protein
MLIISKRKDYYDGVVGTVGVDKTIVYNRECEEFNENQIPELFYYKKGFYNNFSKKDNPLHSLGHNSLEKTSKYNGYSYFIIGFCGKLYLGWKFYIEEKDRLGLQTKFITEITYDREFARTQISQFGYRCNLEDSFNYFDTYNALQLFIDLKAPIFVFDADYDRTEIGKYYRNGNTKFFLNHNLNDYQFYKVFDTFQAFQEVQMFISNVLTGEKEIIVVEDKYKITQHGFNKWSFRKESTKK